MSQLTDPVASERWLECLEADYLRTFVRDGGSAVKFGVAHSEEVRRGVAAKLCERSHAQGYLPIAIDASRTKVQNIEQIFFAVASQTPWGDLAIQVVRKLANNEGLRWPEDEGEGLLRAIARVNDRDESSLRQDLVRSIDKKVYKGSGMTRHFRVAMTWMCKAVLSGEDERARIFEALKAWLTGAKFSGSAVKSYGLHTRVDRANARLFLESLCVWLRIAGRAGLVVVVDIDRFGQARNPRDGALYYSRAAVFEAYESLRRFVDSIDRFDGLLFAVLTEDWFVRELEKPRQDRSVFAYYALRDRIWPDVRDRRLGNPTGALVPLGI